MLDLDGGVCVYVCVCLTLTEVILFQLLHRDSQLECVCVCVHDLDGGDIVSASAQRIAAGVCVCA